MTEYKPDKKMTHVTTQKIFSSSVQNATAFAKISIAIWWLIKAPFSFISSFLTDQCKFSKNKLN